MDVVIIIGIIIIGGGIFFLITNLPKKPKDATANASSSKDSSGADGEDDEDFEELEKGVIGTGKVTQVAEKCWVLNPKSLFPLTIIGIGEDKAQELKTILDIRYNSTKTDSTKRLLPFIKEHDIRCKEIDDYVKVFRPIFLTKMNELNDTKVSWEGATPGPALKKLNEFAGLAIDSLEIKLFCDLEILFRGHPKSKKTTEELITKYGADVMKIYTSMRKGINTVPYKPEIRKSLQRLEKLKLLAYGADVNPKLVLRTLSLDKMKALVNDLNYPVFENKKQAFSTISRLPDLSRRLQTKINFKTIYQKLPIPAGHAEFTLSEAQKEEYLHAFTDLLSNTYFAGGIAIAEREEFQGKSYSFVKGWEISAKSDACIYCQKQAEKGYAKEEYPRTPIHLGCRCTVMTA